MENKAILWESSPTAMAEVKSGNSATTAFYGSRFFLRYKNEEVYDNGFENGMAMAILMQVFLKHDPKTPAELWEALNIEMLQLPSNDNTIRPIYWRMMDEVLKL